MIDLLDELAYAIVDPPMGRPRRWLSRHVRCPLAGCCRISVDGELFYPDLDGSPAFIFAVLAGPHVCDLHTLASPIPRDLVGAFVPVVDLVAWRPSTPDQTWLRVGAVAALGEWSLEVTDDGDSPLRLWSTPLAWAAADFQGALVIDWRAVSPHLLTRRQIVCDTVELGERLEQELKLARRRIMPPMPTISVAVADDPAEVGR